jgi:N-acetylneuraminic acid mutarotase
MGNWRRTVSRTAALLLALSSIIVTHAFDPTWVPSGNMTASHQSGLPFLLPDGNVLVIGGLFDGTAADHTTNLFDAMSGTWSAGPPTVFAHGNVPQAVQLADGRILLTGGRYGSFDVRTSAELFDPATNVWTATGSMQRGRAGHTLTRLADGRILAAGGWTSGGFDNTAEIYDPATGTWAFTANMSKARWFHTATLLNDGSGRVLVAGGENYNDLSAGPHFRETEYFDPVSGTWTPGPLLGTGRADHKASLLPDGRIILIGGIHGFAVDAPLASTEILDGASWLAGASMSQGRIHFPLAVMADGTLLVTGGTTSNASPQTVTAGAERYDPVTNTWSPGGIMNSLRRYHFAIGLADGRVLIGGGQDGSVNLASSEIATVVDMAAPATAATPSPAANIHGWNNTDVMVTLEATDNHGGTGVQSLQYFLPGSNNLVSGNSALVNISAEGMTTLTYHATDVAGNVETMQALPVRIDKTAPFLPGLPNLSVFATSSAGAVVTFGIPAWDNVSGIASTQVSPLSSGMTFPPGTTHVTVIVVDFAGNSTMGGFDVTVNPTRPFIGVFGGTFMADGNPHPATASATESGGNPVPGTFNFHYTPGGASAPMTAGRYSAAATFTSNSPAFTSMFPWTTLTPDPHAKSSPAVVEINGRLYVYGFDQDAGGNQSSFVPRLSIYDPASNTWTIGRSPSLIRAYANAVAINGRMYVVGGCVMADCSTTTGAMEIYDPATDTWSSGPNMPTARFGAAAGVIDGKLYVTGGTVPWYTSTNVTEIYDPAGGWTEGMAIPTSRELPMSAVINGELYVMGGFERNSVNGPVNSVDVFNPITGWSSRASMPTARYAAAAGVINGRIHVVGGAVNGGISSAANEVYSPNDNMWTAQMPMPTPRHYLSGGVVNQKLFVIDGTNGTQLSANEVFDPSLTAIITINPGDTTPPTTSANYPLPNANGWNRFDMTVFLNANDPCCAMPSSGTQSITYTLTGAQTGGGTFNTGSTSFMITAEGTTTVTYYATDNAGNVEAEKILVIRLDKTAPSLLNIPNQTVNATSSAGAVIAFNVSATDTMSGIATTTAVPLANGATFPHGNTNETVTVVDFAGNSTSRFFNVTVNPSLVSISVSPSTATVTEGEGGQSFQASGVFTDGVTRQLGAGGSGGGGGFSSNPSGATWQMHFMSLDVSACSGVSTVFTSQGVFPNSSGNVSTTWGNPALVQVNGTVTPQEVNLTLTCIPSNGTTGSIVANWTGTRYEGTALLGGPSTPVVIRGWSSKTSMPTARHSFGAATVNGMVYAMGGGNPSLPQPVDAYNPATDTWSTVSQLPTSREGAGVAALDGLIYVAGGNVAGGVPSGILETYDPASNTWNTSRAPMTPRAHLALVAADGKLYAMGGHTGPSNSGLTALVERYDPILNQWTTMAPMSAARALFAAGALNSDATIVVAGGAGAGPSTELYTVSTNSWASGPAMLSTQGTGASAVVNNALFVFGGGGNSQSVQMFRPEGTMPGGWAALALMPTSRGQSAAAAVGEVVYVMGGLAGGASLSILEAFSTPPPGDLFVSSGGSGGGGASGSLPTVQWQSTDMAVASISQFGFATGNTAGETTIVATANGISCVTTNTCAQLTVTSPARITFALAPGSAPFASVSVTAFDLSAGELHGTFDVPIGEPQALDAGSMRLYFNAPDGYTVTPTQVDVTVVGGEDITIPLLFSLIDMTPPTIDPHANVTAEASGPGGAAVSYSPPATHDAVDGDGVATCSPASGSIFPIGHTTVTCSAADPAGNHAIDSFFDVLVADTTPPVLTVPADISIVLTTAAASSAVATFTASAIDLVDGAPSVSCAPGSGSTFPVGTTIVSCTATDYTGNGSQPKTFKVIIVPKNAKAPKVEAPANITVEATGPSGAIVTFTATATDPVYGNTLPVICTPGSGSIFPLGVTTVICSATNDFGRSDTDTTRITVRDRTEPTIVSVTPSVTLLPDTDEMVPVSIAVVVTDVVDPAPACRITRVRGGRLDLDDDGVIDWTITGDLTLNIDANTRRNRDRTYRITVKCTDASGNSSVERTAVVVSHNP